MKGNIMSFDLSKNNFAEVAEAGYEFELKLPGTGEGTGAFITVRGDQSKTVKAYARKKYSEFKLKEQQAKRRGKEVEDITLDEAEELAIESAVIRVIDWKGIAENGKDVPFTKENAERIFKEHSWIREAVTEEAGQLLNFRPA
jgi:hypothetical protein